MSKHYSNDELDVLGKWDWEKNKFPPYWGDLRLYVFRRDGYRCDRCHKKFGEKKLDAHHISWRPKGSDNPRNLATVCEPCHNKIHLGVCETKTKTRKAKRIISASIKFVISALSRQYPSSPHIIHKPKPVTIPLSEPIKKIEPAKIEPVKIEPAKVEVAKRKVYSAPRFELINPFTRAIPNSSLILNTNTGLKTGYVLDKNWVSGKINIKVKNEKGAWVVVSR